MHCIPLFFIATTATVFAATHQELITADNPVAYWRFDDALDCCAQDAAFQHELKAVKSDAISFAEPGPRAPGFPGFDAHNVSADFTGAGGPSFLRVKDPGAHSVLDFTKGDTFSAEAWVQCDGLRDGQDVIVAAKGAATTENWALRLLGARVDGAPVARVAFSFHDQQTRRWSSSKGFMPGEGWQHIAVTYTFGKPDSAKAWINGVEVEGKWNDAGTSEHGPAHNNEDVWIGGATNSAPENQFPGRLDELAIFRAHFTTEKVKARARREGTLPEIK